MGCLTYEIKCCFFQAAVMSILLYGCTTWTLTKRMEKKLGGDYTRSNIERVLEAAPHKTTVNYYLFLISILLINDVPIKVSLNKICLKTAHVIDTIFIQPQTWTDLTQVF